MPRYSFSPEVDYLRPNFFLAFRQVRRRITPENVPGLLKVVMLREGLRSCYSLSIWKSDRDILEFNKIIEHVVAANWVMGVMRRHQGKAELWSTQWALTAASRNLNWDGFDLKAEILRQKQEQEAVPAAASDAT